MPFTIVRQDITKMEVDAIVNAANTELLKGGGVCGAIFRAAGASDMQAACDKLAPIRTGDAVITPGFKLPAKYVIHAAGPVYRSREKEKCEARLRSAYVNALKRAVENGCTSVAFPLISSGIFGYPKEEALKVATSVIREFLDGLKDDDMDVILVIYDKRAFAVSQELLGKVENYINENFTNSHEKYRRRRHLLDVEKQALLGHGLRESNPYETEENADEIEFESAAAGVSAAAYDKPSVAEDLADLEELMVSAMDDAADADAAPMMNSVMAAPTSEPSGDQSLSRLIGELDEPFGQMLLRMIDARGMTDVEVYKRANIDRKLFSKIKNVKGYTPSKRTVIALAVAMRLTAEETEAFLRRAGFALSHAVISDVIIEFFITHGNYDVFEINEVLFQYDQPLLGA